MSLARRLGKLEARAPGGVSQRCASCGVPAGWVPHWRWIDDLGADLDPVCPLCKFPLDARGKALMAAPPTTRPLLMVVARENPGPLGMGVTGWVEGVA